LVIVLIFAFVRAELLAFLEEGGVPGAVQEFDVAPPRRWSGTVASVRT
jgi:hypothetical protein